MSVPNIKNLGLGTEVAQKGVLEFLLSLDFTFTCQYDQLVGV